MNSVGTTAPSGIGSVHNQMEQASSQQSNNRNLSLDLGRIFELAIDDFIKARGDIEGQVVVGAANYLIQIYKERMTQAGSKYGRLKKMLDAEGIKIHEPYVNDGIEAAPTGMPKFDPSAKFGGITP